MKDKKQFMIFLYDTGKKMEQLSDNQRDVYMKRWFEWDRSLSEKGLKVRGEPLTPDSMVIEGKDMKVSKGFHPLSKYVIGMYYIINADSLDDAVDIAKGCPTYEHGGVVQVREINMDMM